jgi:hypothetical protein
MRHRTLRCTLPFSGSFALPTKTRRSRQEKSECRLGRSYARQGVGGVPAGEASSASRWTSICRTGTAVSRRGHLAFPVAVAIRSRRHSPSTHQSSRLRSSRTSSLARTALIVSLPSARSVCLQAVCGDPCLRGMSSKNGRCQHAQPFVRLPSRPLQGDQE